MKLHDLFPGSFNADHFLSGPQRLTIKGIVPILFEENGESQQKGKMTFEETSNYWVFGKEAAGELAEQIQSDDTDEWVGHVVELRRDKTTFKGKLVACVRASFAEIAKPAAQIAGPRPEDMDLADLEAILAKKRAEREANAKPVAVPA